VRPPTNFHFRDELLPGNFLHIQYWSRHKHIRLHLCKTASHYLAATTRLCRYGSQVQKCIIYQIHCHSRIFDYSLLKRDIERLPYVTNWLPEPHEDESRCREASDLVSWLLFSCSQLFVLGSCRPSHQKLCGWLQVRDFLVKWRLTSAWHTVYQIFIIGFCSATQHKIDEFNP